MKKNNLATFIHQRPSNIHTMTRMLTGLAAACLFLFSCTKTALKPSPSSGDQNKQILAADGFRHYLIKSGNHFCEGNVYKELEVPELKFSVRFDSTAVYTTSNPGNQYDINKLWGFADNGRQHHEYSARIGWRWSDGALRLFGYVYNEGVVISKEISVIPIGAVVACSISVREGRYLFVVNEKEVQLPRKAATAKAKGYQLYPYFGGDEAAPHDVNIWLREE